MKIAVLQGSSQKDKNRLLREGVQKAVQGQGHQVLDFGVFPEEQIDFSYVQTALCVSMLLESRAIDFAVTGCSSGQGMMLACNSLPGVLCGYLAAPADAYLFGRINGGNAASVSLGLGFGWAGEIGLQAILDQLFAGPFGTGYPPEQAARKRAEAQLVKTLGRTAKKSLPELLPQLDEELVKSAVKRDCVFDYIQEHGQEKALVHFLRQYR